MEHSNIIKEFRLHRSGMFIVKRRIYLAPPFITVFRSPNAEPARLESRASE